VSGNSSGETACKDESDQLLLTSCTGVEWALLRYVSLKFVKKGGSFTSQPKVVENL
jgi:hypothetical protein